MILLVFSSKLKLGLKAILRLAVLVGLLDLRYTSKRTYGLEQRTSY